MALHEANAEKSYLTCQVELQETARYAERLNALWKLATRHGLSDNERFHAMLSSACTALGMELAILGEFDGDYVARYVHDTLGVMPEGTHLAAGDTICKHVLEAREPRYINDLRDHAAFRDHPLVTGAGMVVYAGLPIWAGEEIHGVLAFMSRGGTEAGFHEPDIAFMELVADWMGLHLQQSRQRNLLEQFALTDLLTGILNRRAGETRLNEELARARRHDEGFAIAMLDLDHFKQVNDRFGHAIGDQVLQEVANRLKGGLREDDWVARWGGEEFLVFLRNADTSEAVYVVERLLARVRDDAIQTNAGALPVTLSAGIGLPGRQDVEIHRTLELADTCLYQAKLNGRDRIEVRDAGGVLWPAQVIKRALRDKRVRMAAQPIVDLATGVVVADESLARVILPDGGLLPAGEFIEAAEGLGLMQEIDRIVSRIAMSRCAGSLGSGEASPNFAHFVNLSPQFLARRELVEEMLANAQEFCRTCGVKFGPIKPIVFEITERQFLANLDTLEADLKPLLDFGFRLALDDFGSGYSSFLYLARLPISFLKIEGWMVANMRRERKVAAIVESLAVFARHEGIVTVAECVEDEATHLMLRDMGVDLGQGWYFGRPELVEEQG